MIFIWASARRANATAGAADARDGGPVPHGDVGGPVHHGDGGCPAWHRTDPTSRPLARFNSPAMGLLAGRRLIRSGASRAGSYTPGR